MEHKKELLETLDIIKTNIMFDYYPEEILEDMLDICLKYTDERVAKKDAEVRAKLWKYLIMGWHVTTHIKNEE